MGSLVKTIRMKTTTANRQFSCSRSRLKYLVINFDDYRARGQGEGSMVECSVAIL